MLLSLSLLLLLLLLQWCEAWVTLGRACLNTGRPQAAAAAFSRSLVRGQRIHIRYI
jgi:cytochrome c-type biogenesis protein CcmH/NrfG